MEFILYFCSDLLKNELVQTKKTNMFGPSFPDFICTNKLHLNKEAEFSRFVKFVQKIQTHLTASDVDFQVVFRIHDGNY